MVKPAIPKTFSPPAVTPKWLAPVNWLPSFLPAAAFLFTLVSISLKWEANWPAAILLLLVTASTLARLSRQLPLQNVLLAALLIAIIGSLAHAFTAIMGIPFGQLMFGAPAGIKLFNTLPWIMPFLWVVMVLNSRGVARLALRPWRKTRTYGFWLMGMTALLTMFLDGALEPFATHVKHYWLWPPSGFSLTPSGAPASNLVGWLVVTLLMLAFVTPSLINKQLSKRSEPDYHPLIVWLAAIILFAIGAAIQGLWLAVAGDGIIALLAAGFAIRGGRW